MAEMYIGTIHGFCLDLLRSEVPEFAKYDVLNDIQQVAFVDRNSNKSGLTQTTTLQGQELKAAGKDLPKLSHTVALEPGHYLAVDVAKFKTVSRGPIGRPRASRRARISPASRASSISKAG
jgi:hypothetical protein